MVNTGNAAFALLLFVVSHTTSAGTLEDRFTPGISYYYDDFESGIKPWEPGQSLNFEEVFKNYQYYEIIFDQDGEGITVNRYLRGSKESSERYFIMPDDSLRKR